MTVVPVPSAPARLDRAEHVARGISAASTIRVARAQNATLWDADGRQWIDFAGGIGVLNAGHCHPRVVAAIREQAERLLHSAFFIAEYDEYIQLCKRLGEVAPGTGPKKAVLVNSGAEAVENAVKIARAATGRPAVVAFDNAFHGRTLLTLSLTGKVEPYKAGFGPFAPEVYRAPFPYLYRRPADQSEAAYVAECARAFERLLETSVRPRDVACVIFELVQGEGGFIPAPPAWVDHVIEVCRREGILVVVDEVQTGFGRTGGFFASEHYGLDPDLTVMAKSLAAGLPLAAVVGRAAIMDAVAPGGLGGTFGGNPVACAAACAVLDVFEEEQLVGRGQRLGQLARARLERLHQRYPMVGDLRGIGPMLAIELVRDRATREPAGTETRRVLALCLERGLLAISAGMHGNVIRLLFPLTIPEAQLREGLDILEGAVAEVDATLGNRASA